MAFTINIKIVPKGATYKIHLPIATLDHLRTAILSKQYSPEVIDTYTKVRNIYLRDVPLKRSIRSLLKAGATYWVHLNKLEDHGQCDVHLFEEEKVVTKISRLNKEISSNIFE